MTDEPQTGSPILWTGDGPPRSRRFGDVYFSAEDGLAESRAVFLQGCGLPEAWAGRRRFVVGELGFGTGLNIAALLDLWRRARPLEARLHVFSVEAFPIAREDAARAFAGWPGLAEVADLLVARWPGRARGRHRVELPEFSAILDLAVMDAAEALEGWTGRADAWFLDGFAPAVNPQMWTDEVLRLVCARSAAGAHAATFTVAGQVRRGLAAAGFEVAKRPGFGRKRERLEARLPGVPADPPPGKIAVIGGGIAGVAAARAVRALGARAVVVEAEGLGAGGSGNPAALVTPRLDAGLGPAAQLFAQAFARAVQLYRDLPAAVIARGVMQLAPEARDRDRFARIAASDLFEPGTLRMLKADESTARIGESASPALDQAEALVISPAAVLRAWAGETVAAHAASLEPQGAGWRVLDAQGGEILRVDAVIVAAGLASQRLLPALPLEAVRGQASWMSDARRPPAAAWGGYVLPTHDGLLFGATHDRGDTAVQVRAEDHLRNLQQLAAVMPGLAGRIDPQRLQGRASIRAVTPDRLPLAGGAGPRGVFVLTGLGSRGFAFAPLLAEHVAALALGAPSPIGRTAADLVDPGRFERRSRRRQGVQTQDA